jgi:site-specific recombinase XerD
MIEDLELRGYSQRTQQAYVSSVRQLAVHYAKPPDRISEAELRDYFLYLKDTRKLARASITIALCGIKFFYQHTLGRDWQIFDIVRPPRERRLPVVLSRGEVRQILACVRIRVYRVCLTTIYACGLRLMEWSYLGSVDSSPLSSPGPSWPLALL